MKLSETGIKALRAQAQQHIDSGLVPSCQYAIAINGEVVLQETLGSAPKVARYMLWSATKAVVASVVWQLMGEGKLRPEMRVVELWPEFGKLGKDKVTLDHLLLHTAGFPLEVLDVAKMGDRIARNAQMEQWPLAWKPGTGYGYHSLSVHHVMAELVERVTGTDWRVALRQRVLDPMGLDRLELGVPLERQSDIMPLVHVDAKPDTPQDYQALGLSLSQDALESSKHAAAGPGQTVDPNRSLYSFQLPHALAAGIPAANAVSDAASLAMFYQHLLLNPKHIFDPAVLHDVTTNVRNGLPGAPFGLTANRTRGLILQETDRRPFRTFGAASPRAFGHPGAAGQVAMGDPATGLSFVYFQNGDDLSVIRMWKRMGELINAAITCLA